MVNRGITVLTSLSGFSFFQAKWLFSPASSALRVFLFVQPLLITALNYKMITAYPGDQCQPVR